MSLPCMVLPLIGIRPLIPILAYTNLYTNRHWIQPDPLGLLQTQINILRHSRRFFICAYKALLPAA
ncbi:hypothetical protein GC349_20310, partial [Yersinia pestis]|nr:hypothetical protein [Yersinia pestis]MBE7812576.1 hypothetical protein [Yersinia pestis]MBE7870045.1 hypothetical protein [Yersinia pestis]